MGLGSPGMALGFFFFFCSLTVDLRARPLGSGVLVGGADGVSDGSKGLKQRAKEAETSR